MRVRPLIGLGVAAAAALAFAYLTWFRESDGSLERVLEAGVLRVGYAVDAPFAMLSTDGRLTGESPETVRALAKRLGVPRIEFIQLPFQALIPDLQDRRLDMIASGLFITPERAARVRFADPTVRARPGVLVRRGNPKQVTPFHLLAPNSGYRIAVMAASVEEARLLARGFKSEELAIVPDAQAGRAAVAQGVADGLALSTPTLHWIANSAPEDYEVLTAPKDSAAHVDYAAFAFHPDDVSLHRAWNRAQAEFIGSKEHLEIVAPFGFEASDLAADVTAREVLRR